MKTTVRPLLPADMQSFADLCASRDNLDRSAADRRAEVVEWLAFHNPVDDGNPTYFIGAQEERVMAHLGRMPTLFVVDGRREMASYFHDLYVHPELRKEQAAGFFLSMKLYRQCEKASQSFCAMIWTNQINISLQKARKYTQMWTDMRVLSLGVSHKLERNLPAPAVGPANVLTRGMVRGAFWLNGLRLAEKAKVERITRFDQRFDQLADRLTPDIGVSPLKTSAYLNWKYVDRPHLDAAILQLLDGNGRLAGFAVVVHPDRTLTASIAELVVVDRDRNKLHGLLGHAIHYLGKKGADRVEATATDPLYSKALEERLFRRDTRIPLFLAGGYRSPSEKYLHSPRHWHLSLGDSEGPF